MANLNAWEEEEVVPVGEGGGTTGATAKGVDGRASLKGTAVSCPLRRSASKGRVIPYPRPGLRSAKAWEMPGRDLTGGARGAVSWQ